MGQPIYVQVDANAANGIMTMEASGGGQEEGGYWLNWTSSGFTGIGWFWEDTPLPSWWENYYQGGNKYVKGQYTNNVQGFSDWIVAENPSDLNAALGTWNNDDKVSFLKKHLDVFAGCVS